MVAWLVATTLVAMATASDTLQELGNILPTIVNSKLDDLVRAASDACEALPLDFLYSRQYPPDSPQLDIVEFTQTSQRAYRAAKAHLKLRALNVSQLVLYVPGWHNTPTDDSSNTVIKALLTKHPVVFVLDTRNVFCCGYVSSALKVRPIAQLLYSFLKKIQQDKFPMSSVHLIGFSLGAHVVGMAGKMVRNKLDTSIGRITALDPARPCFTQTKYRLDVSDADFVQVMHSSAGVIGLEEPLGHVDVYINGIGTQPDCINMKPSLECDHSQAWKSYAISVLNETDFTAKKCLDWRQLENRKCSREENVVGYGVDPALRGIFLHKTAKLSESGDQLKVFNIFDINTWW